MIFKVDRLQIIVVAKNITVLQLFISRNTAEILGSLSKRRENVTWKCNFVFLPSFLNYSLVVSLPKWVLTILDPELNWNQPFRNKTTKMNICHHMRTSSTQPQNRSFHVVERTRTSTRCLKMKNALAKRAKLLCFTVKYANLWCSCCRRRRSCLSSLLKTADVDLDIPCGTL